MAAPARPPNTTRSIERSRLRFIPGGRDPTGNILAAVPLLVPEMADSQLRKGHGASWATSSSTTTARTGSIGEASSSAWPGPAPARSGRCRAACSVPCRSPGSPIYRASGAGAGASSSSPRSATATSGSPSRPTPTSPPRCRRRSIGSTGCPAGPRSCSTPATSRSSPRAPNSTPRIRCSGASAPTGSGSFPASTMYWRTTGGGISTGMGARRGATAGTASITPGCTSWAW